MLTEVLEVKRYLGCLFGVGENIPDGVYAIPTKTSKGNAFMRCEIKNNEFFGNTNYKLFWDEKLKICWYTNRKPLFRKESKYNKIYRKTQNHRYKIL
jgi:hypothetical protein